MNPRAYALACVLGGAGAVGGLPGCAHAGAIAGVLARVAQGAQAVSSFVDAAVAGKEAYFARHPNQDAEQQIDAAVKDVRLAIKVLNEVALAGQDLAGPRHDVTAAYDRLVKVLYLFGVTDAMPLGGAETDAPEPKPFTMPATAVVAAALE